MIAVQLHHLVTLESSCITCDTTSDDVSCALPCAFDVAYRDTSCAMPGALPCDAAREVADTVAALGEVAARSHDAGTLFTGCAADWAAFADELVLQLPRLAEGLEQRMEAVSAATNAASGSAQSDEGVAVGVAAT